MLRSQWTWETGRQKLVRAQKTQENLQTGAELAVVPL